MHYIEKNYVLKPIYNDENECINDTLSINFPNFLSKHRMQRNILNWIFKTPRHQEQMTLSSSIYEKTYLYGSLEGVLGTIQVPSL